MSGNDHTSYWVMDVTTDQVMGDHIINIVAAYYWVGRIGWEVLGGRCYVRRN